MDKGMVHSGMVRKIDDLGRIVVPAETRKLFHINEGDQLEISVEKDSEIIILRKLEAVCTFCGSNTEVRPHKGKGICSACVVSVCELSAG